MARAMGKRHARKAPDGAEDDGAAIFRPVPGLREPGDLPMAHAMGYSLSLLRASIRSIYGIPVLLSRTRINERSCPLPPRRAERCRSYELRFAAFTESQFFCRPPSSMREAAHSRPDEPNAVALTSFDSQHWNPSSFVAHPHE